MGQCDSFREQEGLPEVLKLRYARCRVSFLRGPGAGDEGLDEGGGAAWVEARSGMSVDSVSRRRVAAKSPETLPEPIDSMALLGAQEQAVDVVLLHSVADRAGCLDTGVVALVAKSRGQDVVVEQEHQVPVRPFGVHDRAPSARPIESGTLKFQCTRRQTRFEKCLINGLARSVVRWRDGALLQECPDGRDDAGDVSRWCLAGFPGRVGEDVRELMSEMRCEPVAENGPLCALGTDQGFVGVSRANEKTGKNLGTLSLPSERVAEYIVWPVSIVSPTRSS